MTTLIKTLLAEELPVTTSTTTSTYSTGLYHEIDCDKIRNGFHPSPLSEEEITYLCNDTTVWGDDFLWWEGTNWKERPECLGEGCDEEPAWDMWSYLIVYVTLEECVVLCYEMEYLQNEGVPTGLRCWGAEWLMPDMWNAHSSVCNFLVTWDPTSDIPLSDVVPQQRYAIENIDINYYKYHVYHAFKLGNPESIRSTTTTTTSTYSTGLYHEIDCDKIRNAFHDNSSINIPLSEEEITYLCNETTVWGDDFLWWEGTNWKERPECLGDACDEEPAWNMQINIKINDTLEECVVLC